MKKVNSKMKSGKAAGPSGLIIEMFKASSETGIHLVKELANSIVSKGVIPVDWEVSCIVNSYM